MYLFSLLVCFNAWLMAACGGSPASYVWNTVANTNQLNGQQTSDATVAGCQASCIANAACLGFDWDGRCWLAGPWSGAMQSGGAPGVTHYTVTRIPATNGTCG